MSVLHVLYENEAWMPPLRHALEARRVPWREHLITGGTLDLGEAPPEGVYLNRMSPSAHTRDHQGGVRFLQQYLAHLEAHGRRVINGSRAFALEVSKVAQDRALRRAGIRTPHTIAVVGGAAELSAAARRMRGPFVTKHNQGGRGLGVHLFRSLAAFDTFVHGEALEPSPDGVTLLQEYIEPAEPFITRVELVDGVFQYAIRSSTEQGFELCPADACAIDDQLCPVGGTGRFSLREDLSADDDLVVAYRTLLAQTGLDVAGIEFVEDRQGRRYTYDINGTTNFNGEVESAHGLDGMAAIAALAARELGLTLSGGGTVDRPPRAPVGAWTTA